GSSNPDSLRLEIIRTVWSSFPSDERTDTLVVIVGPGQHLAGDQRYMGWFPEGGPFSMGTIVSAERAWIVVSRSLVTTGPVGGFPEGSSRDTVLVTTAWRSFHTQSDDAGFLFRMRLAPERRPPRLPEDGVAEIVVANRSRIDVIPAEAVGLFR